MYKSYDKNIIRRLHGIISLIIPGLCLLFSCRIHGMWMGNDDGAMMHYLAGYSTNIRTGWTYFTNVLWAKPISLLYAMMPSIQWYIVVMYLVIYISLVVLLHNLLYVFRDKPIGILVFLALYSTVFLIYSISIQWTVVAAMSGMSSISGLIRIDDRAEDERVHIYIPSVLLLFIAYMIRAQVGLLTLSSIFVLLFFHFASKRSIRKEIVINLSVMILSVIFAYTVDTAYDKVHGYDYQNIYNTQLGKYIDYGTIEYDDNASELAAMGWDEELLTLVNKWFLMDRRVDVDAFERLAEIRDSKKSNNDTYQISTNILYGFVDASNMCSREFCVLLVAIVIFVVFIIASGNNMGCIFTIVGMLAACICESLILIYRGRFPNHVYQSMIYVFLIPVLLICVRNIYENDDNGYIKDIVIGIATLILCIPMYTCVRDELDRYPTEYAAETDRRTKLEEYVIEHPGNIYIYDSSIANAWYDPSNMYEIGHGPNNMLFWGGANYNSPLYYMQLYSLGVTELYSDDFMDENIYFCGTYISEDLDRYMNTIFDGCRSEIIDSLDGMVIYRYVW